MLQSAGSGQACSSGFLLQQSFQQLTGRIAATVERGCVLNHCSWTMDSFRQRRTSSRIATRSHKAHGITIRPTAEVEDAPAQPAAKRRKTSAAKHNSKGLGNCDASQRQHGAREVIEQAASSTDTVLSTAPAVSPVPSVALSDIPSGVPADPNALNCWTKDSMAKGAAHLAAKDAGRSC